MLDTNQSLFKAEYTPTIMSPDAANESLDPKKDHPHNSLLSPPE